MSKIVFSALYKIGCFVILGKRNRLIPALLFLFQYSQLPVAFLG